MEEPAHLAELPLLPGQHERREALGAQEGGDQLEEGLGLRAELVELAPHRVLEALRPVVSEVEGVAGASSDHVTSAIGEGRQGPLGEGDAALRIDPAEPEKEP